MKQPTLTGPAPVTLHPGTLPLHFVCASVVSIKAGTQRRLKRLWPALAISLCALLFAGRATAQDYRFALGVRLSNDVPTINNSVTGKYFVTDQNAIEGMISFGSRFGIGALLELHRPFATQGLSWFFGGGAYIGFEDNDTYLGPAGVLGLDYRFPNVPVNLSVDWKPELDIIPRINFVPEAFAVSIRFVIK